MLGFALIKVKTTSNAKIKRYVEIEFIKYGVSLTSFITQDFWFLIKVFST